MLISPSTVEFMGHNLHGPGDNELLNMTTTLNKTVKAVYILFLYRVL